MFFKKILEFFDGFRKKNNNKFKSESYYEYEIKRNVFIISVVIFILFSLFFVFFLIKNDIISFNEYERPNETPPLKIVVPYPNDPLNIEDYNNIKYEIRSGNTLYDVLTKEIKISNSDANNIVSSVRKVFDLKKIKVGQILDIKEHLFIEQDKNNGINEKVVIEELRFKENNESEIVVMLDENKKYNAFRVQIELNKSYTKYQIRIENNLYQDGVEAKIPPNIMFDFIKMFSFDIDFQRDLRKGDEFEVLFEVYYSKEGERIKSGDIIYASLNNSGRIYNMYKYNNSYYDKNGQSVQKSLLRTPINGARISSNFGMRRHPVLGYSKKHEGKDFAAPTGTPFFAAGAGTVVRAGPFGSFGNYVRIKHTGGYETEYAHASKIANGIRAGVRVKQGQTIAFVGTTGRSTGPHLHFGVIHNGKRINPDRVKSLPTIRLIGKSMIDFNKEVEKINLIRKNIPNQFYLK